MNKQTCSNCEISINSTREGLEHRQSFWKKCWVFKILKKEASL